MSDVATLEAKLKAVTARLAQVEAQLAAATSGSGAKAPAPSSSSGSSSSSAFVGAYENLISSYIDPYVSLSAQIDPDVKKQADLVKAAVTAQRDFLASAASSKKPSASAFGPLLQPTASKIQEIIEIRNKARGSKVFNWLSTLSEGISALGWVQVEPTPGPFVDEARASSEFYSNKILVEFKTKAGGDLQRQWVAAWNDFLKELRNYIKQYHTTGVTWNPAGGEASVSSSSSDIPSAGGAPPPPSGAPVLDLSTPSSSAPAVDSRAQLLAQINAVKDRQTGGKTEGLHHVQAHEKSKNQKDRPAAVVKASEPKSAPKTFGAKSAPAKPPKLALEGNKWVVEFQNGNKGIVISETEPKHTVYIFKCENSVIQVKGKVNAITLDSCKKTGIVFESAIATIEVVNSQSVEVQIQGSVPSIAVDKTDGCQIFLSKQCLGVELVTSKCSEMNVMLPAAKDGDDPIEKPVPEQFKTLIKNGNLVTEAVQHTG